MKNYFKQRRWLAVILLAYFVLGLGYSIVVPLAEAPDESEHFLYLQYIQQQGALPVMSPVREENVTLEAHQPPLLYLVGAILTSWIEMDSADNLPDNPCFSFEPDDPGRQHAFLHRTAEWPPQRGVFLAFQLMRWFSLLLGAGTIILTYQLGRQVYPADRRLGVAAAAILAFNPQFIFITASINNDVLTALLGTAIVLLCGLVVQQPRHRYYAGLGLLIGLGSLTKFALLAFWPLVILAVIYPFVTYYRSSAKRQLSSFSFRSLILNFGLVIVIPLLLGGWWYWRGYQLYGDPLLWDVTLAAKGSVVGRSGSLTIMDLWEFISIHFQSYWLWFGWLNVKAPQWVYGILAVMVGTAVIGLLRLAQKQHLSLNWPAVGFSGLAVLAVYASLIRYIQTINWTGYQGRLAFAVAGPIAVFLALGFLGLFRQRLAFAVGSGLFVLSAAALLFLLWPAYPRPVIYQPAPDLTRTCIRFDNGLQVEAVDVPTAVKSGDMLPVTVYGYGLAAPAQPESLVLRLVDTSGVSVSEAVTEISWQPGEVVSATAALPLASDTAPAQVVLEVGMLTSTGEWQAARSAAQRVLTMPLGVEAVKIGPARPFLPTPQQTATANFANQMALIGYDGMADGHLLTITLYWQALADISQDYTTFVHLLDNSGQIITQMDGQPQNGRYPTSIWDVGEIVADTKTVNLSLEWNGSYQLVTGVYLLETGQRLAITDAGHSGSYPLSLKALAPPP